jgi:hypothetical protein
VLIIFAREKSFATYYPSSGRLFFQKDLNAMCDTLGYALSEKRAEMTMLTRAQLDQG